MRPPLVLSLEAGPTAVAAAIPVGRGVRAGISLAASGDMAFSRRDRLPHRERFLAGLGVPPDRVRALRQVHSHKVVLVGGESPAFLEGEQADGTITRRSDVLLTITVADCLPLFLLDRASGAFGLVHSGWKGTGIVIEALRAMGAAFGTRPADVQVTIGPGIGPCCYTVPEERAAAFAREFGAGSVARSVEAGDTRPRLDLRAANVVLLQRSGVEEVTVIDDCTGCTPSLGSFRRQGPEAYTLMLAWIGREGVALHPEYGRAG